ncbi:MAG: UDP-glucose 4-epimerase GalE [Flavobacteriaceae bacterium]|nr:UDP-glucose 4-epimerase GalE [Flavobacteriaceae bacterium]
MNTILVTGGLGYIGSHSVVQLLNKDYDVVICDNLSNSYEKVFSGIKTITGKSPRFYKTDVRDTAAMLQLFKQEPTISGIIHFAALKAVGESVEHPLRYYDNNVNGLIQLLKSLPDHRSISLVFSSSCTVYGEPEQLPIDESAPIKPATSPYGYTKQVCENILSDSAKVNDHLRVISLRYFNPIGAHPSGIIGELPIGKPNNLIPFVTQTAAGMHQELVVFGDDYDTRDGTCIRDYIDVIDLADAHILALERLFEFKNSYEVFNLGTGTGSTVLEVIQAFEQVNQVKLPYRIGPRRAGDVIQIFADNTKSKKILGWEPTTPLEVSLKNAWNWQQKLKA